MLPFPIEFAWELSKEFLCDDVLSQTANDAIESKLPDTVEYTNISTVSICPPSNPAFLE
jgi:hypothetical protein